MITEPATDAALGQRIAEARIHIESAIEHGINHPPLNVAIRAHLMDALAALDGEAGA